uniref:Uncharacterized protein n=1 Tax=Moniliophthora roreri TaxID=221103 RepID=A0A0W0FYE8_MONRR
MNDSYRKLHSEASIEHATLNSRDDT